jgi:oxygen-dependent protoporphyrinogen oxidase
MISFPGGIQALPRHLAQRAGEVTLGAPVTALRQLPAGGWEVRAGERAWAADEVVLAVDSEATVRLVAPIAAEAALLGEVPYAPVVVAGLGYARAEVSHPLDGFGYLAPRGGSVRILGCLFTSSLFADRAPEGHVALTTFAGGRTDPGLVAASDEEVLAVVRRDLERSLGVTAAPRVTVVERWPRAIPQYEVGHGRFVARVRELEARLPGLRLAGNFTGGVSVNDCVRRGREVAAGILGRERAAVGVGG